MLEFNSETPLLSVMDTSDWKCPSCRKGCICNACLGITRGARYKNPLDGKNVDPETDESDIVSDEHPLASSDKVYSKPQTFLVKKESSPFLSSVPVDNKSMSNFASSPKSISPINTIQSFQAPVAKPQTSFQHAEIKPINNNGNSHNQVILQNNLVDDFDHRKNVFAVKQINNEYHRVCVFSATQLHSNKSVPICTEELKNCNSFVRPKQYGPIRTTAIRVHQKFDDIIIANFKYRNSRIIIPEATRIFN